MKRSWKDMATVPRFVQAAVRKGVKLADSIGIEEADDKSWLTITFKRFPVAAVRAGGVSPEAKAEK